MAERQKVLLVHPLGYRADAADKDISRLASLMPPLGLASIAAYLDRRGFESDILDCFAQPRDADTRIREYMLRKQPRFIGFSCTTSSFLDAVRLAHLAKSVHPGVRTVFGGPHVSALRETILERFPVVDFVVVGEGEETMAALMAAGGEAAAAIPGLVCRDRAGAIVFTGFREPIRDLDSLPFPAYEKLAGYPRLYELPVFNYPTTPNASCVSSRGCPYRCTYCDRSVFRRSFRWHSAPYMVEHVRYLNERFGVRHINFYDDLFTFNRERVVEFARLLIDGSLKITFNCAVRAEHVDPELLRLLKQAGCWMISLGIETGDADLLSRHRQNADLDRLAATVREIKAARIRVKGLLMIGLPGETEASFRNSMAYVFALPIDDFNLTRFTPFPGSPIYEQAHELGAFAEDWEKMDCLHTVFVPNGMTPELLDRLFLEFYKRHFLRLRVLGDYVSMGWRSPDSWRRFVCNLFRFLAFARTNARLAESR